MAKYTDLRPTRPDDSLKKLLKNTVNKQTIPYGNKVARAHEGTTFFTTDGSSYRWDGETIAVYDTRIREAEKAVADAREQLAQAQADLADAKDRIGASSGDLSGYADRIKAAEETLAAAVKDQASLTEKIKAAEQGLSSLEGEVTQAQAQASRAVTAANGKSTNFYGSATPSNPKTGDTWFTEGSFKTWDGKAWVEYTDPKISAAQATADTAKASADGKNQIFRQSSQPTAKAKGDVWFNTGSGNQIKVWDGRAWVDNLLGTTAIADAAITTAKIGALDAAKITTGTLSADRIGTGAVTADKLAGKSIDASKIVNGSITGVLIQNGAVTANKIQAGTITANSGIIASLDAGVISTGTLDAGRIGAKTITGDKINAESVAAAVGQFVKVDAKNLTVTQELAANVAKVMSLDAKKLIVNGEALIANATLLGDTVADRLNVTKKLVARDAIVDGTLDVAQLNVTEKMAAEIVNAMSVNAKKLVVSEEAIMNNLTVIQNIVTPELIAKKINVKTLGAELITSGAIQTSTAANQGVKISDAGYKAYDAAGNLTVDLNGKDNRIVGNFTTSSETGAGIKITQTGLISGIDLYPAQVNSVTPDNHGSMWWDGQVRGSDQGLVIAASRNAAVADTDPGIILRPASGISFQGKFARSSLAFQSGVIESKSMGGGGWVNLDVTFPSAMTPGASVAVFISPVNENKVECAIGVQSATTAGFKAVVKNMSNNASGYQWIKWFAIAI